MRNAVLSTVLVGLIVTVSGCQASDAPVTGCPADPAVSFRDSESVLVEPEMMDAVAAETERFGKELIGMAEGEALQCVEDAGLTWRIYEKDGEQFALTMDYRVERVNLKLDDGIVTDAYSG